jgi:hypothetical protein
MPEILTTHERSDLKQNPSWIQRVIKKPNTLIEKIQGKLTLGINKHTKVLKKLS